MIRGADGKNIRDFKDIRKVIDMAHAFVRGSTTKGIFKKGAPPHLIHDFSFPCLQQTVDRCGYYVMCHMEEFVRHYNRIKTEEQMKNNMGMLGEKYDYDKDHCRVVEVWATFVNQEVMHPKGEFYAGLMLPEPEKRNPSYLYRRQLPRRRPTNHQSQSPRGNLHR